MPLKLLEFAPEMTTEPVAVTITDPPWPAPNVFAVIRPPLVSDKAPSLQVDVTCVAGPYGHACNAPPRRHSNSAP